MVTSRIINSAFDLAIHFCSILYQVLGDITVGDAFPTVERSQFFIVSGRYC
ncbi:MAG: hypothetical protein AVDCRST_MAG56-7666 [uncultured Cytophagales bacterium]|uniref:Uncharacterized protein n=1 Tax=uncultured Cytophagales bacterium TaxID=158755 RepID=A0A6J4LM08_9SPHI|nr:MAG: hypothetical protein AVDCRST_MAG56-7666 [uncultured Cytophagales bacterium]